MILRERLMKKYAGIMMVSLMLTAVGSMQAGADEVYYQHGMDGYTGGEDATITSSGTWPIQYPHRLRLRYDGQERYNTLIRFEDLAELEEGSYVSGATLTLTYQHENVAWKAATVDIHQCLRSWSDPDWIYADPGSSIEWGHFGAQDPCTDRGELVGTDTYMGPRKGYPTWIQYTDGSKFEFTLDASMVQSWIEQPNTNYGLILIMNYDAATDVTFSSNEDADPCTAPLLTIYVESGVVVPDVVGMEEIAAVVAITRADLQIGIITSEPSSVPAGYVIRQDPEAGAIVDVDTEVDMVISEGPQLVTVPDVMDWWYDDAVAEITYSGLVVGAVEYEHHSEIDPNHVFFQSLVAGSEVEIGSVIDLKISLGPVMVVVPPVVGESHDDANSLLFDAQLTVGEVEYQYDDLISVGYVISQDPNAGDEVTVWSEVNLVESLGEQSLPDFNGDYITNLIDFNQLASEWMSCDPCVVTTDMTADGCVQVDDLVLLAEGWLQYHCKNRPEADVSGNCCVDMEDLAILLSEWLTCDEENIANIDGDGEGCVNLPDLSVLSSQWGLCGEAYEP